MSDQFPERKLRLADAGNTTNPALRVILAKGFHVYFLPNDSDRDFGDFWAIKDGRDFIASDPLRLLGLIAIWEASGDDWQGGKEEPDFYDEVMDAAYPDDDDYTRMDERHFREHTAHLKPFFDALRLSFNPETVTREELLNFMRDYQNWFECDDEE